ncbi:uncharacterized protein N7484_000783 [Penicillium longicatenatum]|uniref:uncharacterized protein n=1 Tax=Penicillium longicatenatum TaxID=1561947 RepID=UPI00254982C3|nr:uncharacterized protein N7484_000783 [Penicillium longicatenatum]KAJ5657134.1 hypothetical protein N7484_000783 [Penicillium longicatenatum]
MTGGLPQRDRQQIWIVACLQIEARRLREKFHDDHERARKAIDECVGHHVVVFLPYDYFVSMDVTDATADAGYESP